MSNGVNYESREIIFSLKSKLGRAEERIAVLENLVQSVSDDRDGYVERAVELEDERDRARATAVALEQQLAEVMSSLQDHIDHRRVEQERHPGDINSMALTAAENALKWAETAERPVYQDDFMEEVPF